MAQPATSSVSVTRDIYNELSEVNSINAQAVTATLNGTSADLQGFESAQVLIDLGTFGGTTPTATIQIQDSADDATFAAVAAADLQGGALPDPIDTTNDAQLLVRGYIGSKRYVRVAVTATGGTSPSLPMSATIQRGHARTQPV